MKRVKVEHEFTVADEVTDDQIANLVGTMTVQVEEPVVGHTEDSLNELTIETNDISSKYVVNPHGWSSGEPGSTWTAVHRHSPRSRKEEDGASPDQMIEWLLEAITHEGDVAQRRYDLETLARIVTEHPEAGYGVLPIDHDVHPEDCVTCHGIDEGPQIRDGHPYLTPDVVEDQDMRYFLHQNTITAAGLTTEDAVSAQAYAQHHAGGLVVLGRDLDDGRFVKMHDSWGDDGKIVVHRYDPNGDEAVDNEWYYTSGHEAYQKFLTLDDEPVLAEDSASTEMGGVKVTVTKSAGTDGAWVVFVDTEFEPNASDGGPGLRVLINDHDTYAGKPYQSKEDS